MTTQTAPDIEVLRANLPAIGDSLFLRAMHFHDGPSTEAAEQLLASLDGARILVVRMAASIRVETPRATGASE